MKYLLIVLLTFNLLPNVYSQPLPDSITKKIDSLFSKWNVANSPGCVIGVVKKNSLIYSKGYGLANLEYNIPNGPETIYHMASVSKQFTGWAIILLARQGKLRLDDDVRKHLKWFPDLGERITIRHLLNHTSGIRDQWQLLAISGTRLDDVITQEHIVKLLSNQKALNFKPGEKHSYSNSGYTMMAEIVKSVTGQTLRKFTDSAIFKPLGMSSTHFHDDYEEIEKNRAYSYNRGDKDVFSNSILSYSNAGATSLFTNVNDMSKWVINFYRHTVGDQQDVDSLTQKGRLNSGKELSYASGIVKDLYKGWKQYSHGGGDAGYRTYLSIIPDLEMGFMIFSNDGSFNSGGMTSQLMDLFVTDTTKTKLTAVKKQPDSIAALLKDTLSFKRYAGHYIADEGLAFSFFIRENRMHFQIFNDTNFLIKEQGNVFYIPSNPDIKFTFNTNAKGNFVDVKTPDQLFHLVKYIPQTNLNEATLKQYTGTYYCPELDCKYGIALKDSALVLTNFKYNDSKIKLVNSDHLTSDHWWINHLVVLRNNKNEVIGFEVNSGRIMHLRFNKISNQ